jgi:hypothetical protein
MNNFLLIICAIVALIVVVRIHAVWSEKREARAYEAYKQKFVAHLRSLGLSPEGHSPSSGIVMFPDLQKDEITILCNNGWTPETRAKVTGFHADVCTFFYNDTSSYKAVDYRQRKLLEVVKPPRKQIIQQKMFNITDASRNIELERQSCPPAFSSNYCAEIYVDALYGTIWCRHHHKSHAINDWRLRWSGNCAERGIAYSHDTPNIVCLDLGIDDGNNKKISKPHRFVITDDQERRYRLFTIDKQKCRLFDFDYDELMSVSTVNTDGESYTYSTKSHSSSFSGNRTSERVNYHTGYTITAPCGVELHFKDQSSIRLEIGIPEFKSVYDNLLKLLQSRTPQLETK